MSMRRVEKPKSLYDKRVPKSEKYKHITGRLDTGLTTEKVKFITVREFSRRRDEIYYRLTKDMLANLFEEYESDENYNLESQSGPKIINHAEDDKEVYDRPYLLLDCREKGQFDTNHLLQARSFPYTLLKRDQLHPEMYQFRNKEEHLIVVYCDNENISRDVCKTLVDRGIENTFLLTGGFVEFAAKFPQFVEGAMPDIPLSPSRAPSRKMREKREFIEKIKSDSRGGNGGGRGYMDSISERDDRSERGSRFGGGESRSGHGNEKGYNASGNDKRSEYSTKSRATGERRNDVPDGFGFRAPDAESNTPRKAYSQSTLGSPNMSNRVKQALDERREKLSASRGGDGLMRSPGDDRDNRSEHGRGGRGQGRSDRDDDNSRERGFSENIKGLSERMARLGGGERPGLNSARLRAHEEAHGSFDRDDMDRASARGGNGHGNGAGTILGQHGRSQRERDDYDDDGRMSCRSTRSVANSIISRAASKKNTGKF